MERKKLDLTLYVITDENLLKDVDIAFAVEEAIKGGATVIQYRAKNKSGKYMFTEALKLKEVCDKYNIPLFINDRVDIALAVKSDGIHTGQNDLPIDEVYRITEGKYFLGWSTKKIDDVIEANKRDYIDYIGFGSIFPTKTKQDIKLNGLEELEKILKISNKPVVAIGGINHSNVVDVLKTGCKNVAVVSAVFKDNNIYENTARLRELIERFKG
ncbi:MAG: thiamine phosphate synthase [Persephonella sp.]|nr:MAG: thiamine phosphate synthase [Persephonella sp.]RUM59877.1 MAG: thiamine phosphate synthase [Persephonella sp.]